MILPEKLSIKDGREKFWAMFEHSFLLDQLVNNIDLYRASLPLQGLLNDIFGYLLTIEFYEIGT